MTSAALIADIEEAKAGDEPAVLPYGEVEFRGVKYAVARKPNTLLLSELARTQTGDPEALSVFAEFFESTLGDNYRAFKKAVNLATPEVEQSELFEVLQAIMENSLARPTE